MFLRWRCRFRFQLNLWFYLISKAFTRWLFMVIFPIKTFPARKSFQVSSEVAWPKSSRKFNSNLFAWVERSEFSISRGASFSQCDFRSVRGGWSRTTLHQTSREVIIFIFPILKEKKNDAPTIFHCTFTSIRSSFFSFASLTKRSVTNKPL